MHFYPQLAFEDLDVESIYLLTDGKPDNSTSLVLREVAELNTDRSVVINTISFNCHDRLVKSTTRQHATFSDTLV